ncbi:MAG: 50S ribosomal protein L9 [Thermodesulfobacteriota bacterium]
MELILKETIDTLGREGDIVTVKAGYGRNYLLPQGKAVMASADSIAMLKRNQAAIEARLAKELKEAEAAAKKLSGVTVTIAQLAGEDERLFGSVTSSDISEKLAELDFDIDKKSILLSEPIKSLGETSVPIKVGFQVSTEILVKVVPVVEAEEE